MSRGHGRLRSCRCRRRGRRTRREWTCGCHRRRWSFPAGSRTELRADDVHDAAVLGLETEQLDTEFPAVVLHLPYLPGGAFAGDLKVLERCHRRRRRRVIHRREHEVGTPDRQAFFAQQRKCLRRRDFVDDMQVDVQDRRRIVRFGDDDVVVPDLVEKRSGFRLRHVLTVSCPRRSHHERAAATCDS